LHGKIDSDTKSHSSSLNQATFPFMFALEVDTKLQKTK